MVRIGWENWGQYIWCVSSSALAPNMWPQGLCLHGLLATWFVWKALSQSVSPESLTTCSGLFVSIYPTILVLSSHPKNKTNKLSLTDRKLNYVTWYLVLPTLLHSTPLPVHSPSTPFNSIWISLHPWIMHLYMLLGAYSHLYPDTFLSQHIIYSEHCNIIIIIIVIIVIMVYTVPFPQSGSSSAGIWVISAFDIVQASNTGTLLFVSLLFSFFSPTLLFSRSAVGSSKAPVLG